MSRRIATVLTTLVLVAELHDTRADAQDVTPGTRVTVSGLVTDPSSAVLAGALVQVTEGARVVATTTAAEDGRYRVELAPNARYRVRVSLDGFTEETFDVQTQAVDLTRDVTLPVSGIREQVVVTAGIPPNLGTPALTGSRLALSPLQTPASVEVIDRELIQATADPNITAVVSRATGIVNTSSAFGYVLSARGFTGPTSVMTLYDGSRMYIGGALTFPSEPWMADRIEVLRGPASVLYGEGAIGAAINVVRRAPTRQRQNEVRMSGASYDTVNLGIGSGGPLTETLSYRLDVALNRSGGWMDRGESSTAAVSAAVAMDVSDALKLTFTHDFSDQKPRMWFGVPTINGVFNEDLRKKNYNVADPDLHFRDHWTQVKADWTPSSAISLNTTTYYLTNHRYWHNAESHVWNPASNGVVLGTFLEINNDQWQIGNRTSLRATHRLAGRPNHLVVGFDVNRGPHTRTDNAPFGGSATVDAFNPAPVLFIRQTPYLPKFEALLMQYSLFAEDRIELGSRWSFVGGARMDRPTVRRDDFIVAANSYTTTFESTSLRAGLVFNPKPNVALYGQYATATDPVSSILQTNITGKDFDPATGRQWEVGVKNTFGAGRGEWTFAAYDIVKKRILTRDLVDPNITVQIGQQSSRGVEGSIAFTPVRSLQLQANASFLEPRYDDFAELVAGVRVSRNGQVPVDTARRSANVLAFWQFAPRWQANTTVRYVGRRFKDTANTSIIPAYTVVDAALQWDVMERAGINFAVRNLTDELYARNIYNATQWIVGDPRVVELSLRLRF